MNITYPISKRKNLIFVYSVIVFFTLIFNRPWAFSVRSTANTLYTVDSVSSLVYIYRIIPLLLLLALLVYKDLLRKGAALKTFITNVYFIAALIYGVISSISALVVYGDYFSVWKSIEFLILIYFFAFVYSCKFTKSESKSIFSFTLSLYVFYIIVAGILAIFFPEVSFRSKTIQFFPIFPMVNPNVMGILSLITLSFILLCDRKSFIFKFLLPLFLFSVFVLSISRTAYIAFVVISIVLWFRFLVQLSLLQKVKDYLALFFFISTGLLLILVPVFGGNIIEFAARGQSTESLQKLSSRTLIWEASRLSIKEKPFFGYGLYAETRRLNKRHPFVFDEGKLKKKGISNTHGSLYEILLASGFLGGGFYLILFFITILRIIWFLLFNAPSDDYKFHITLCIVLLIIFFRFSTGNAIAGFGIFSLFYYLIISLRLLPWRLKHSIIC